MDLETVKMFGQYGGVAGLALVTLIVIFREIIKKLLGQSLKLPPDKTFLLLVLMIVCSAVVTVTGIGAWVRVSMRQKDTVAALEKPAADTLKALKPLDRKLVEAVSVGKATEVDRLLKAGANPNATDAEGQTALHYAAAFRRAGVVGQLLKSGASPAATNRAGVTPYGVADFQGDPGIKMVLADSRAKP
jgi:hypothetical protein